MSNAEVFIAIINWLVAFFIILAIVFGIADLDKRLEEIKQLLEDLK